MFKRNNFSTNILLQCGILLGCLALTHPAFGQFSLVSSTPVDGATNVSTLATFELTFNAPLDTSAKYEVSNGFFLGIEIYPADSAGDPGGMILSSDLKKVTFTDVPLTEDTQFIFLLSGAKSNTGASLDHPYVITFTTGNSLPTGSVSGEVFFPGGSPSGAVVAVFKGSFFANDPVAFAVALSPYTAKYLPDGTYYLATAKDTNGDGNIDPFGQDAFGFYDKNGDGAPDSVVVSGGGNVPGINMNLSPAVAQTARENYQNVEAAAQSWAADAALAVVSAPEISPDDGKAFGWLYGFFSESKREVMTFIKITGLIVPVEIEDGELPDSTALPGNWIDSDIAADSAEAYGGSEFRVANPDAQVAAVLANLRFDEGSVLQKGVRNAAKTMWSHKAGFAKPKLLELAKMARSYAQPVPAWIFEYFSPTSGEFFRIFLDAVTGSPLPIFQPAPTTARTNLDAVNQAAASWASDATLVLVGNASTDLTRSGVATAWSFVYYSATKDSSHVFFLVSGLVVAQEPVFNSLPSKQALPDNWIDTPAASAVAEANSNSFRNTYADAVVQALLTRGLLQNDPQRAVWQFTYFSSAGQAVLILHLDAVSGALITGVKETPESNIPKTYALEQNYPNPFNPETVIKYQLPQNGAVELTIFNLLGHKVRELVNATQPGGSYEIRWDGKDDKGNRVAGGVYFYQLKAGAFVRTKKMILLQ